MEFKHPIEEVLNPFIEKFIGQEGYFVEDDKALKFFHAHPLNTDPQDVLLKVGEIRDPELTAAEAQDGMTQHILSLVNRPQACQFRLSGSK